MKKIEKKYVWLIIFVGFIFFFIYNACYFSLRPSVNNSDMWIFNTPDETANYFFIQKFAENNSSTGGLKILEPLNNASPQWQLVHPRSITALDGNLTPGGFLGFIIILGTLAKIIGLQGVFFCLPIFSIFAVVCFYFILKKVFDSHLAFITSLGLFILPAFWYYNSRLMLNNILFIDLAIVGFYLLLNYFDNKKIIKLIASGLTLGLALSVRTTDALWLITLIIFIFIFKYWSEIKLKKIPWRDLLIMAFFGLLGLLPVLYFQNQLYGSPFSTGYLLPSVTAVSSGNKFLDLLKSFIAPFGFNTLNIISNLYHYFVSMFWWLFWPAVFGGLVMLKNWRRLSANKKAYFVSVFVVGGLLILYYGSWKFTNNLLAKPLIGSSQVRYFLPLYILSLPLAVYGFDFIIKSIKNKYLKIIVAILTALIFVCLSANSVWRQGEESLVNLQKQVKNYYQINNEVKAVTPVDSVIITSYNDKVFFPDRKVITYWQDPRYLKEIEIIGEIVPLYFYGIDGQKEISYIESNSVLKAQLVKQLNKTENLYKLNK